MKKLLNASLLLLGVLCLGSLNQCSFASDLDSVQTDSMAIRSHGWRYMERFAIPSFSGPCLVRNWPEWTDTLCSYLCDYANSMGVSKDQSLHKHMLIDRAKTFAISIGLLSRSVYDVFEIGGSEPGEPRFVGCKHSQKSGTNPVLYPYADWSIRNLPFISKTSDIVGEIQKMGKFSYSPRGSSQLFLYPIDSSGTEAAGGGFCNVFLMEVALSALRQENIVKVLDPKISFVSLLDSLISKCQQEKKQ